MGWVIAAVVVVALGGVIWWSSWRAKPLGTRFGNPSNDPGFNAGRADVDTRSIVDRSNGPHGH